MPISAHREFFATLVTANVGVKSPSALQRAFASTPREDFLGPGPWRLLTPVGYIETPSDDPAFVYYDAAISVLPLKNINNGQPTLHAMCLSALKIREGETITHIGAGTGYYTALLSQLTGPSGAVHAFELEAELADRAAQCLSNATNVRVHHRSGTEGELPASDFIYVSAGATGPHPAWLDALVSHRRPLAFSFDPCDAKGGCHAAHHPRRG